MRRLHLVHSTTGPRPRLNPRAAVDPVVRTLLEHVRIIVPLSPMVRARALARARAAIAAQADDLPPLRASRRLR